MVKPIVVAILSLLLGSSDVAAFTLQMGGEKVSTTSDSTSSRIEFLRDIATVGIATVGGTAILSGQPQSANAAPEIFTTDSGIKYAITKAATSKKPQAPLPGDIVAIDYTGYLSNGQIFDATHAEGKNNALLFKIGSGSVIPGLDDMVSKMVVGQKVQAIIPPKLAYADKGVCLDEDKGGECLIKPGSTLVYDIMLKKSSIPPP